MPVQKFVRFLASAGAPQWGRLDGAMIQPLSAAPYNHPAPAGEPVAADAVRLLAPVAPPKIFAIGLNYRSHLGSRPVPPAPEVFYKPTTCLVGPGDQIVIPHNAANVHFEGELVLVIGRTASRVTVDDAPNYIFGVTCGNDVSERDWQRGPSRDLQWWRAKGADTFGPTGPVVASGLDYNNLGLTTRLNGEVVQQQTTADLIFSAATIVSYVSQNVTLEPGDLVFTGTPGTTKAMAAGDIVEVELSGIGILRNPVTKAQ